MECAVSLELGGRLVADSFRRDSTTRASAASGGKALPFASRRNAGGVLSKLLAVWAKSASACRGGMGMFQAKI
jgi:hypothetical protein